jgi:hypothetical protein
VGGSTWPETSRFTSSAEALLTWSKSTAALVPTNPITRNVQVESPSLRSAFVSALVGAFVIVGCQCSVSEDEVESTGTDLSKMGSNIESAEWDPNRLDQLADPSLMDAGDDILTFRRLSLAGCDHEALMDNLYAWPDEVPPEFVYPPNILELDGQDLSLIGYQFPVEFDDTKLQVFMLVRDLASCCFGGSPLPDEWVYIEVPEDLDCDYYPYQPVVVSGHMQIIQPPGDDPEGAQVYRMKATKIRKYY